MFEFSFLIFISKNIVFVYKIFSNFPFHYRKNVTTSWTSVCTKETSKKRIYKQISLSIVISTVLILNPFQIVGTFSFK